MPVACEVRGKLAVLTASGEVSAPDFDRALQQAAQHPAAGPGSRLLILDTRSGYQPTPGMIPRIVGQLERHRAVFERVAVVVDSELKFGIGRMIAAYAEPRGLRFRVFQAEDEARAWLDRPVSSERPGSAASPDSA